MVYEEILVLADPEWKASPGSAGNRGNIRSNASLDITRPFMATSVEFSRDHVLPSYETQASPGAYTNGSPSHTPYVSGEDTSIRKKIERSVVFLRQSLSRQPNPAGERKVERFGWTFAPGDKVMQIENDYDKDAGFAAQSAFCTVMEM